MRCSKCGMNLIIDGDIIKCENCDHVIDWPDEEICPVCETDLQEDCIEGDLVDVPGSMECQSCDFRYSFDVEYEKEWNGYKMEMVTSRENKRLEEQ